jgi:hypothetical protein
MVEKQEFCNVIRLVARSLAEAREHGLEAEVMASTMMVLKEDPKVDLSVALQRGLAEWDI